MIFQPLVSMGIFTIFFGKLAKIPSGSLQYSLFVLIGLVFWNYFSSILSHASDSMVSNENIIKKIYFPKIILPLSAVITSLVDFSISFVLLLIVSMLQGVVPRVDILYLLPLCIVLTIITSIGLGLLLASINVKYRDVRYILPFFTQILLFLTPVIYPLSIVSDRNKLIMALNPMTTVVETMRCAFSTTYICSLNLLSISIVSGVFILLIGLWFFYKNEQFFADIV